ncbi:tRNA lysidine(34) synthetase TilS [Olivibacter sitiensis]|uniref:tRNA lysidine(34) synthetase TilS n=1 Tax=Olivibacter sitiensis TaxID=376470 RepID=UPI000426D2EF|nr:tRNA lysidine(34) synthetase TilS [Olivibacter sitiensis]
MNWVKEFLGFIHDNYLLDPDDKVLLAVSGGRDSMLMAYLFAQSPFAFGVAHCNFGLRGEESDGDEELVRSWSEDLGVPFHVKRFDTKRYAQDMKISTQMAARNLRYEWFSELMKSEGYNKLAVAHHKNDSVETVLLNLCRGTGLTGLHGILVARNHIVRPLLYLSRQDIDRAIMELAVTYREDSSNLSDKYARNRIRLQVIPELKKINPSLENTFEKNIARFGEVEELLDILKEDVMKRLLVPKEVGFDIDIAELKALRPLKLMSYMLFSDFGFSEATIDDLLTLLEKEPQSGKHFSSSKFQLWLDRGKLQLRQKEEDIAAEQKTLGLGERIVWKGSKLGLSPLGDICAEQACKAISVDADKLVLPLEIRSWQQGDYFRPFGMRGTKKISDFFVSVKLPRSEKQQVPLVVNGNGDIIWVAPFRMDNRFRVQPSTNKIYNLTFEKYEQ